MEFAFSPEAEDACGRMWDFMRECVLPAEPVYEQWRAEHRPHDHPPVMEDLKAEARRRGLWNLFLPSLSGLTNVDYASVAEISGWSPVIAPEAINCQAPDTGNMETLDMFATPEQKKQWLDPLLDGTVRSAFAMTEPEVASSDATNIATRIERDGDDYVVSGRKWWVSGAADQRCQVFLVMGKTDPAAPAHRQQSMILVPRDAPGLTITRHLPIFGYQDQHGHSEVVLDNVRVPGANRLAGEGDGFMIAQARLGPGRIHHAMRAIGMAERALGLMVDRATARVAFGGPLIEQGVVQELVARSRIEIEQARLLVLKTAWLIDRHGAKGARTEIAAIKVAAPAVATAVIDRAIEVFGAAGVSDDFPLAYFYAWARVLRIVDGPDAVHRRSVAQEEVRRHAAGQNAAPFPRPSPASNLTITTDRMRRCPPAAGKGTGVFMVETGGEPAAGAPLRRFPLFRSAAGDEVRARLSQLLSPHRSNMPGGGSAVWADLSAVELGPLSLVYCRTYGGEIGIELTEQVSYYDVNFALAGRNRLECDDERVVLTPQTAGIISPSMRAAMHLTDGYSQLHLRIERFALERHLERMLGRHVAGPIRFRAEMDLTTPALASWAQAVQLFVRDLDEPSGLSGFGPRFSPWADFLLTGLLLAQPHDHSAQLAQERADPARPLPVRRVVELIEREPASDLTLDRLAAVAGVGPRSLQRSFRIYMGVSSREYIQSVRLARAHDDLAAGTGSTVAEIAFRWGFTHVPRFAGLYRERYGVAPSATLRESRPDLPPAADRS